MPASSPFQPWAGQLSQHELDQGLVVSTSDLGVSLPKGRGARRLWGPRHWALRHVNFELKRGETIGVLGRNGSGKSTLLRTLAGIILSDEGNIRFAPNLDCVILAPGAGFDNELTGRENLYASALFHGHLPDVVRPRVPEILAFSEIGEWIDEPVGIYSAGMRARLGFSLSLFLPSDILMIDETLSAGDITFREKAGEAIVSLVSSGRTVIVVSHNLDMMRMLCSRGLLLDAGQQVTCGGIDDVIKEYHDRNVGHAPPKPAVATNGAADPIKDAGTKIEMLGSARLASRVARRNSHSEYLQAEQRLMRASAHLIELQTTFIDQLRSGREDAAKLAKLEKRCVAAREQMEKALAERDLCRENSEKARSRDENVLEEIRKLRRSVGLTEDPEALAEEAAGLGGE